MKTITIANQKGGCGKTTTALMLAYGLAEAGYRTLLIDMDSQENSSWTLGKSGADAGEKTTSGDFFSPQLFSGWQNPTPSDPNLFWCALLSPLSDRRQNLPLSALRDALGQLTENFDYVVLDTPPALGRTLLMALMASDGVIIPMLADIYSMQGLAMEAETIEECRKRGNPSLRICGLLLCRYSGRSRLSRSIREQLEQYAGKVGTKVYQSTIRESVAIRECQYLRKNLFRDYAKEKVTEDARAFIREFLQDMQEEEGCRIELYTV